MAMKNRSFAALILTHGRPDRVVTYSSLRRHGYTGRIVIVVDNEDKTLEQYRAAFGDQVYVFDKKAVASRIDEGDNFNDRRAIIYARNASFEIAQELGLEYFIQLDDDYTHFQYRKNHRFEYIDHGDVGVKNLDRVFDAMVDLHRAAPIASVAMAQGGDFLGGSASAAASAFTKRKCMNSFICATARPFQFVGRINEDVNTYVSQGGRGLLFFTALNLVLVQRQTQQNKGGMSELYLDRGTYMKSFYTVMYAPSCVKISTMGNKHRRIHHRIAWRNAVPLILREELKKARD